MALAKFDAATLGHVTVYLDCAEIRALLRTGDVILAAKLDTQVKSLHFSRTSLLHPYRRYYWDSTVLWGWPSLITQHLRHLTKVKISKLGVSRLKGSLKSLPPTLTRLSLKRIWFVVPSLAEMRFNLPQLLHLKLISVDVSSTNSPALFLNTDWLLPSLANSPFLISFSDVLKIPHIVPVLPSLPSFDSLETLALSNCIAKANEWPPNLTSFTLIARGQSVKVELLPQTITYLSIDLLPTDDDLCFLLALAPCALRSLEFQCRTIFVEDPVLRQIARFTQLHTLLMPKPLSSYNGGHSIGDLSLLPKSITVLSESFTYYPQQWPNLPPKARLTNVTSCNKDGRISVPRYKEQDHAAFANYLPVTLSRIQLNCALPQPSDAIREVYFVLQAPNPIPLPSDCASLLTNLPPTLTSIDVNLPETNALFWLNGNGQCASTNYPHLQSLQVVTNGAFPSNDDVVSWLHHIPTSLHTLTLHMYRRHPRDNMRLSFDDPLALENLVLPPHLTRFSLICTDRLIELPVVLPASIDYVSFQANDVQPAKSIERIKKWPTSIHELWLRRTNTESPNPDWQPSINELQWRIYTETSPGHKLAYHSN